MTQRNRSGFVALAERRRCKPPKKLSFGTAYLLGDFGSKDTKRWQPHVEVVDGSVWGVEDLGNVHQRGGEPILPGFSQERAAENGNFQQRPQTLYHGTFASSVLRILREGLKTDRRGTIFTTTSFQTAREAARLAQGPDAGDAVIAIDPACLKGKKVTLEATHTLKKLHDRALDEIEAARNTCDPQGRLAQQNEDLGLFRSLMNARRRLAYDFLEGVKEGFLPETRVVHADSIPPHCLRHASRR